LKNKFRNAPNKLTVLLLTVAWQDSACELSETEIAVTTGGGGTDGDLPMFVVMLLS
jgi:hypothetical protein